MLTFQSQGELVCSWGQQGPASFLPTPHQSSTLLLPGACMISGCPNCELGETQSAQYWGQFWSCSIMIAESLAQGIPSPPCYPLWHSCSLHKHSLGRVRGAESGVEQSVIQCFFDYTSSEDVTLLVIPRCNSPTIVGRPALNFNFCHACTASPRRTLFCAHPTIILETQSRIRARIRIKPLHQDLDNCVAHTIRVQWHRLHQRNLPLHRCSTHR